MSINEQFQELGHMGTVAYAPSDDVVDQLLARTKRARAVRQGSAAVASSVGAFALGIVAMQAISAAKDDPAFRDRNIIENKDRLPSIDAWQDRYGWEKPVVHESVVDLTPIIEKLQAAASASANLEALQKKKEEEAARLAAEQKAAQEAAAKKAAEDKAAQELAACKADHPANEYPYKYYDCTKGKWIVKSGWFWNDVDNTYTECNNQPDYTGFSYSCSKGKWIADTGYFYFSDGKFYQTITWTDAATGIQRTGNYSSHYEKVVFANPSKNKYDSYKPVGGNATWSGSTCTGITKTKYGAPFQYSCLPSGSTGHNNGSSKVSNDWILENANFKWNEVKCHYYDITAPGTWPAGWTWNGSAWVESA